MGIPKDYFPGDIMFSPQMIKNITWVYIFVVIIHASDDNEEKSFLIELQKPKLSQQYRNIIRDDNMESMDNILNEVDTDEIVVDTAINENDISECAICWQTKTDQELVSPKECNHKVFCQPCLDDHRRRSENPLCPLCRTKIQTLIPRPPCVCCANKYERCLNHTRCLNQRCVTFLK